MPQLGEYSRVRLLLLIRKGFQVQTIIRCLKKEGISVSRTTVWRFKRHVRSTSSIMPLLRSGRKSKLANHYPLLEHLMNENNELTATQIKNILEYGVKVTKSTVRRARQLLGWTYRRPAYCQTIRMGNIDKRLAWAEANLGDDFHDVIWTDETTVQLETHKRLCSRKKGFTKPRAKHPTKIHVWAGISWNSATSLCTFSRALNAQRYVEILQQSLLPSLRNMYPHHHRFMRDTDPKHTSELAKKFFEENGINWWKTPPESPDLNQIENLGTS